MTEVKSVEKDTSSSQTLETAPFGEKSVRIQDIIKRYDVTQRKEICDLCRFLHLTFEKCNCKGGARGAFEYLANSTR